MGDESSKTCSLCNKELQNYVEINVKQEGESTSNVLNLCPKCFNQSIKEEVHRDLKKLKGFAEGLQE